MSNTNAQSWDRTDFGGSERATLTVNDLAHVSWMLDTVGCAIAEAKSPDGESRWAYTVGLNGLGLPELVMFGHPRDVSFILLADLVRSARGDLHPCTGPVWRSPFGPVYLRQLEHAERYLKRADAWEGFEEQEWDTDDGVMTHYRVFALQVVLDVEEHDALPESAIGTGLALAVPPMPADPR